MPDFYPQYPVTSHPVFGPDISSLAQQNYQWEVGANLPQQHFNVAQDMAAQSQAIQNANQFYQFARANEMEDARRQAQADVESRSTAAAQAVAQNRRYEFQKSLEESQAERKSREAQFNKQYDFQTKADAAASLAKKQAAVTADIAAGKLNPLLDPGYVATTYGLDSPATAKALMAPHIDSFKSAKLDALNVELDKALAKLKPGQVLDTDTANRMRDQLPAQLRNDVAYDTVSRKFRWTTTPPTGFEGEEWDAVAPTPPAPSFWGKVGRVAGVAGALAAPEISAPIAAYQWLAGSRGSTATPTPPPPSPTETVTNAPTPPPAMTNAPGQFLLMKDPQGNTVKVPYQLIGKMRAAGYYQ